MNLKNKIIAIICHRPTCSEGEECTCGTEDKAEAIMELMNREWCGECKCAYVKDRSASWVSVLTVGNGRQDIQVSNEEAYRVWFRVFLDKMRRRV
jgi:hypothetical protein